MSSACFAMLVVLHHHIAQPSLSLCPSALRATVVCERDRMAASRSVFASTAHDLIASPLPPDRRWFSQTAILGTCFGGFFTFVLSFWFRFLLAGFSEVVIGGFIGLIITVIIIIALDLFTFRSLHHLFCRQRQFHRDGHPRTRQAARDRARKA